MLNIKDTAIPVNWKPNKILTEYFYQIIIIINKLWFSKMSTKCKKSLNDHDDLSVNNRDNSLNKQQTTILKY